MLPWRDHLLRKAWQSPAILGLQLWNGDARLYRKVLSWTEWPFTADPPIDSDYPPRPLHPGEECTPDRETCIMPSRGDDIGYERVCRPDHVPTMEGDRNDRPGYSSIGRLFAIGYLKGLREAVYAE